MAKTDKLHEDIQQLNLDECARVVGVNERTWRRWVAQGRAPAPHTLAGTTTRWFKNEIKDWLQSQRRTHRAGGAA